MLVVEILTVKKKLRIFVKKNAEFLILSLYFLMLTE